MTDEMPAWFDTETETIHPIHVLVGRILDELPSIPKAQENREQGFMFRGHDDVMMALNPILAKYGVFVMPYRIKWKGAVRTTRSGSNMYERMLTVRYRWYGPAGDYLEAEGIGEGTDMGDKSSNKAMTNAFKYMLNVALAIATREMSNTDSDRYTPEDTVTDVAACPKCGAEIAGARSSVEPMRAHHVEVHDYIRQSDGTVAPPRAASAAVDTAGTTTTQEPTATPQAATEAPQEPDGAPTPSPEPIQPTLDAEPPAADTSADSEAEPDTGDEMTAEQWAEELAWVDELKGEDLRKQLRDVELPVTGKVNELKQRLKDYLMAPPAGDEPEDDEGGYQCPDCNEFPFPTETAYEAHWEKVHGDGATESEPEPESVSNGAADPETIETVRGMITALSGSAARAYGKYRREKGIGKPDDLTMDEAANLIAFLKELENAGA